MDQEELRRDIRAHPPAADEIFYVERRGEEYAWSRVRTRAAAPSTSAASDTGALADAWMYYSGALPLDDPDRWDEFFDDMLAELDSMTGTEDRCRWPLDDPWPHLH